ncbi:hypothetical protein Pnap_2669 [Polaromonas naphthalenivorans CJ2]|uniref:Uncharacterized protein n=1 Tax=Polaromonas naphthalenivorans (strain CJ2) TaxID=365044 RepID=A1VQP3_POLNA|nr:hypothetical protein Pnap_2669 [Polaromonas naphthalenivorans CJ2]
MRKMLFSQRTSRFSDEKPSRPRCVTAGDGLLPVTKFAAIAFHRCEQTHDAVTQSSLDARRQFAAAWADDFPVNRFYKRSSHFNIPIFAREPEIELPVR